MLRVKEDIPRILYSAKLALNVKVTDDIIEYASTKKMYHLCTIPEKLFKDRLMKMLQNAGLCRRHNIPSKYIQKEIQGYNFNFRQGKHKELTNKQD